MKVKINDSEDNEVLAYEIDDKFITDLFKRKGYEFVSKPATLPTGQKVDLSGSGVLSTAIKQACSMVIIPIMQSMAETLGIKLRDRVRHENVLLYTVDAFISIMSRTLSTSQIILKEQPFHEGVNTITDFRVIDTTAIVKDLTDERTENKAATF